MKYRLGAEHRHTITMETIHATLVRMMARGILLVGESGSGKSRLAHSLLYEGARLVSDDVVELIPMPEGVSGQAPERIRGLLEIRGVGIVDVERTLGRPYVIRRSLIDLVVRLIMNDSMDERTAIIGVGDITLCGCEIPEIRVGAGLDACGFITVVSDVILKGTAESRAAERLMKPEG